MRLSDEERTHDLYEEKDDFFTIRETNPSTQSTSTSSNMNLIILVIMIFLLMGWACNTKFTSHRFPSTKSKRNSRTNSQGQGERQRQKFKR